MLKAPLMEQEDNTEISLHKMQDLVLLHQTTTQTPVSYVSHYVASKH